MRMSVLGLILGAGGMVLPVPAVLAGDAVDFNRDIRPILSENCHHCHGRDGKAREAELRLDVEAGAKRDLGGYAAVVAGDRMKSELWKRIRHADPDEVMPPPESKRMLTERQIILLGKWIDEGAVYADHWAYLPPEREDGIERAIDHYIDKRLREAGMEASGPADRRSLIRRVSLDLIGLPPAPDEVAAFMADDSAGPFGKLVDRLLESKRFGEKWARAWLDLARYADSNGFQADQLRDSWAYRDWVIDALNANMPFDRFTIEQLAGDLLPDATLDQKIATGFHRTVTCNVEAGVQPEENRVNQVVDRVNTTGTVWLGTTIECGQCHDHKYDPFTMRDYYGMFAFFNNTPVEVRNPKGTGVSFDFYGPKIDLPMDEGEREERDRLRSKLAELERRQARMMEELTMDSDRRGLPDAIAGVLRKPAGNRSKQERRKLGEYLAKSNPMLGKMDAEMSRMRKRLSRIHEPSSLVMVEMEETRETHVMIRGDYLSPAEAVVASTPASLHAMNPDLPRNRLGLAKWLVDPANPLVARVVVNRWWAEMFGRGIVSTLEDFGTQSEPPTHPKLLDWLAVEFMESGWNMKHVLKTMVMSAAYRRSSVAPDGSRQLDPANLLYARGPRFRMSAEMIRDNALAASGLLSSRMHGPPVMPFQPAGIWRQVGRNEPKWTEAKDHNRYRRGIYVVWRRAAPYPRFVNFDGPDRSSCVVNRPRTNTPLQALTLLNDPAYVEMALALADRILVERSDGDSGERINHGFELVLARPATDAERGFLTGVLAERTERLSNDPMAVAKLLRGAGSVFKPKSTVAPHELAAWFYLAGILLNLDETVTKG